jgi:hypothetical protein
VPDYPLIQLATYRFGGRIATPARSRDRVSSSGDCTSLARLDDGFDYLNSLPLMRRIGNLDNYVAWLIFEAEAGD